MALVVRAGKHQSRLAITGLVMVALAAAVYAAPAVSGAEEPPAVSAALERVAPATARSPSLLAEASRQESAQQGTPPAGQQQEQAPPTQAPGLPGAPELLTPEEREALALVEQLIRDQEGVLMGTGFDYAEGGRRDPFRSLIAGLTAVNVPGIDERPRGLPGFLIAEIDLTAIAEVQGRWHAMVTAPDQRSYFLEVGTKLWDGHVVSIGPGEVIFEQLVSDLIGATRTRQVTKTLRSDGGWETPR